MSISVGLFAEAEPVIRWRRGADTADTAGDQRRGAWADEPLPEGSISIVPGTATEDTTRGFAQTDDTATAYAASDLDLKASDELGWRGARWQVTGTPVLWDDPTGSGVDTLVLELRRREG